MRYFGILFILFSALFFTSRTHGSTITRFQYPLIDSVGDSLQAFIPHNWEILKLVQADFNGDKALDFVVVIQHKDKANISVGERRESFTYPRILFMGIQDKRKKFFRLVEQSNTFILSPEEGKKDPFLGMREERGLLKMDFEHPYRNQKDSSIICSYTFRFELARFYLFGADYQLSNKVNGEYVDINFHFPNFKAAIRKGNEDEGDEYVQFHLLPRRMLQNFTTFRCPYTWEVMDGVTI